MTTLVLIGISSLAYQNCGAPTSSTVGALYGQSIAPECLGVTCGVDIESVQILLGNAEPIQVIKPTGAASTSCDNTNCFDVAGYCDSGGFPGTAIYIALDGPTGFAERRTTAVCDANGRFRIQVQLPANYNYDSLHMLKVTLRVIDEDGKIYNPNGSLYKKEITIGSTTL